MIGKPFSFEDQIHFDQYDSTIQSKNVLESFIK